MEALPEGMSVVEVPKYYAPTTLAEATSCPLKATLASTRVHQMESGPEAAIGVLVHRVLERAWGLPEDQINLIFLEEYNHTVDALRKDVHRRHFADLKSTRTDAQWRALRHWVNGRAARGQARLYSQRKPPVQQRAFGAEVALQSDTLRLRGRADRVHKRPDGTLEVRDFKTGSVLTPEGEVSPGVQLQLRAYGLLLEELRPGVKIALIVDDGCDRAVDFEGDSRVEARHEIQSIVSTLPLEGTIAAPALARPGASCWNCSYRYRCRSYIVSAPEWWKRYPDGLDRLAYDTWGTLHEVCERRGHTSLTLLDVAGRKVRVDGVDSRHGDFAPLIGMELFIFGLQATGPSRDFNGRKFHPRLFYEIPRDRGETRAWSAHFFTNHRS